MKEVQDEQDCIACIGAVVKGPSLWREAGIEVMRGGGKRTRNHVGSLRSILESIRDSRSSGERILMHQLVENSRNLLL